MIIRVKLCVAYVLAVLLLTVTAFLLLKPAAVGVASILLAIALVFATAALIVDIYRDREKLKELDFVRSRGR
ncbi:hypothetical protein VR010_03545 [Actinomycetaceae bacterium L2_0104]